MKLTLATSIALAAALAFGAAKADVAPPPSNPAANKQLVIEAFHRLFVENKVVEEADKYFAPNFIEHDPAATNGTAGLKAFFKDFLAKNPGVTTEMKRVIADGDLVLVHFHARNTPDDRGVAGIDIFRVADGRIVEHWDVIQPVPEKSANSNTMF